MAVPSKPPRRLLPAKLGQRARSKEGVPNAEDSRRCLVGETRRQPMLHTHDPFIGSRFRALQCQYKHHGRVERPQWWSQWYLHVVKPDDDRASWSLDNALWRQLSDAPALLVQRPARATVRGGHAALLSVRGQPHPRLAQLSQQL